MKKIHSYIYCIVFLFTAYATFAQGVNNIYSFTIKKTGDQIEISRPKFLNGYNKNGYNNQPYFKNSKALFVTSQLKGQKQTDIIKLNLFSRTKSRVTSTPEAEYSPKLRPGTSSFNCVRVESDGKTQRLWQFPNNHSSQGKPLFPDVKNVGYYHWMDSDQVALFLVGEPHSLAIGNASNNKITPVTSNIGRGMESSSDGHLLYVQKMSENTWYIKKLNPISGKSSIVIETLKGAEDFVMLDDSTILMAQGAKIFSYKLGEDRDWKQVADLSAYGLTKITRLAFNGERILAVVDSTN